MSHSNERAIPEDSTTAIPDAGAGTTNATSSERTRKSLLPIQPTLDLLLKAGVQRRTEDAQLAQRSASLKAAALEKKERLKAALSDARDAE